MSYDNIIKEIVSLANTDKAVIMQGFFKTSEGQYGHGDVFLGLTVPTIRIITKKFYNLSFVDLKKLLNSKIHEHRLIALFILVNNFNKNPDEVYNFYLDNINSVNNWDLVDSSADKIVGKYLINKDRSILYKLVQSKNLWHRRISIVSTFYFIKNNRFDEIRQEVKRKHAKVCINRKNRKNKIKGKYFFIRSRKQNHRKSN